MIIPPGQQQATVRACHAELVTAEVAGYGTGQPGLAVRVKRAPILAPVIPQPGSARARSLFDLEVGVELGPGEQGPRERVRVHDGKRYVLWEERETFADTRPVDRVYMVDRAKRPRTRRSGSPGPPPALAGRSSRGMPQEEARKGT